MFWYVAKNKNISKAANELFISQPAITQTIQKLESILETKLFYRTKKGVELTNDGDFLYDYIKFSIESLNSVKKKLNESRNHKKVVRIGSGTTLIKNCLIEPLKKFKELYPDVLIEINHDVSHELLRKLDNNLLDIAILKFPCDKSDNYELEVIQREQDAFVGNSKNYGDYKDKIFSPSELNSLPLVLQSSESSTRKFLDEICYKNHVTLNGMYELVSYGLVLDFVKEGLGIGFINKRYALKELNDGTLFEIKTDFIIPPREIGIAVNKKIVSNDTIKCFLKYLKDYSRD
jgi:DNA-binding transcriptional LysR family regulator